MKFEEEAESLPLAFKIGSTYKIQDKWLAGLDVGFPKDNNPSLAIGTEYLMSVGDTWILAGRTGFNSRTMGDVDGFTGISFGLGLAVQNWAIDYGVIPFGSLGLAHRISISLK